jgi:FKBP-type peptidyl-prolyl cis-trans isomerase FkpA
MRSFALASLAALLACATAPKAPPAGPKPFGDGQVIVLQPTIDTRASGVDAAKLKTALEEALAEQSKTLKQVDQAELDKALQKLDLKLPKADRSGIEVSPFLAAIGAQYALFVVVDKAETTGVGALVGVVDRDGERAAVWISGGPEAIFAGLSRIVGQDLQDLGASTTPAVKYPDGLVVEITELGKGPRPRSTDRVKVNYEGHLDSGFVFDTTKGKDPAVFGLERVIICWNEGIPKLRPGAKAKLTCPPSIAYGDKGQGNIPPNATLHFDVELLSVEK